MHRFALVLPLLAVLAVGPAWPSDQEAAASPAETVTVPKAEWEALKAAVAQLQRELAEIKASQGSAAPAPQEPSPSAEPAAESQPPETPPAGGRSLLLPEISVVVDTQGLLSSDERDPDRNKLQINHAELAIQGYVYPQVKADLFVAMSPREHAAAQVEQAYLTYLAAAKGLNVTVGQTFVPFGRTNTLHSHSWLYARQPLVIHNLVSPESLTGAGVGLSYVLPTPGNLFGKLDLGYWTPAGHVHEHEEEGTEHAQAPAARQADGDILGGEGAGFHDHFATARLWLSRPLGEQGELEWGGSYANGPGNTDSRQISLLGTDLTYRRFGTRDRRLLLRSEYFQRDQGADRACGYYFLADQRFDRYHSVGLLYDWCEFPGAPEHHESALSLIYTREFSEQYYGRLQAIHGSRPGASGYNELRLQWVWGMGPHTHELE